MTGTRLVCSIGVVIAVVISSADSAHAVVVEVTEITGKPGWGNSKEGPWEELKEGDVLETCQYIVLPGSYSSVKWKRIENGSCKNTGEAGTNLSKTKIIHVGTEIGLWPGGMMFGAIDLVVTPEARTSEATIFEGQMCHGVQHCGLNSDIAQAAPIELTPPGELTTFSGGAKTGPNGLEVRFAHDPSSPIPLATTPLVGPHRGEIIMVNPGQEITYFADGSFKIRPGACQYIITKNSKAKKGCKSCPRKGDIFALGYDCESVRDCRKKIKLGGIECPDGGGGFCKKVKGKRDSCR